MKFVGKIGEEIEKKVREREEKEREEIKKKIRERLSKEIEKLRKEERTYKVKINDMEIEVPEGFEVVVTEEGTVIRETTNREIAILLEEVLHEVMAIREYGLDVTALTY